MKGVIQIKCIIIIMSLCHYVIILSFRIDLKALLLVDKALNGLGPVYITNSLSFDNPSRPLDPLQPVS